MRERMVPGTSLELGSGIGTIKEFIPGIVTSDLVKTDFVDMACSAYDIGSPDQSGKWANIIAMDMLHHLCRPMDFFRSASAVLEPGGRIVLAEPAATFFGRIFYTLFHQEPIKPSHIKPPFEMQPDNEQGEFANMGMGVSLFRHNRDSCAAALDEMGLETGDLVFRDLLAYPLTGGYSGKQLAPSRVLGAILAMEKFIPQFLFRHLGLRMIIVLEKAPRTPD
jgi:SAM-dependent methyltransferase